MADASEPTAAAAAAAAAVPDEDVDAGGDAVKQTHYIAPTQGMPL